VLLDNAPAATEQLPEPALPDARDSTAECDEYPVLTMWTMRVAAWISGPSTTGYFYASAVMLWIAAFVTAFCLYLLVGDRARISRSPTLGCTHDNRTCSGRARHGRDAAYCDAGWSGASAGGGQSS
jgi:uncharacterized membrane protein YgcG